MNKKKKTCFWNLFSSIIIIIYCMGCNFDICLENEANYNLTIERGDEGGLRDDQALKNPLLLTGLEKIGVKHDEGKKEKGGLAN